jgi:hypothetical protein
MLKLQFPYNHKQWQYDTLTLRLGKIIDRLIAPQQSAFIQGRYILESVVVAHELVHGI